MRVVGVADEWPVKVAPAVFLDREGLLLHQAREKRAHRARRPLLVFAEQGGDFLGRHRSLGPPQDFQDLALGSADFHERPNTFVFEQKFYICISLLSMR